MDKEGATPLMYAAFKGHIPVMKKIFLKVTSLEQKDKQGNTALCYATMSGSIEAVKLLEEKGADIKVKTVDNLNLLLIATWKGHLALSKYFLEKKFNIEEKDNNGYTALIFATVSGNIDLVKFLIEKGADINVKGNNNENLIMMAALMEHLDLIQFFLEKKMDIEEKNKYGVTALYYAVEAGKLNAVKFLIEKGADIKVKNVEQENLLMYVASEGNLDIIQFLLEKKLDLEEKNKYGVTALYYAVSAGKAEAVKLLIEKGANINVRNTSNENLVMRAAGKGYLEIIKILLEQKIDIEEKNINGITALFYAVHEGKTEVAKLLIEKKADFRIKDNNNKNLLMLAAEKGNLEIIKILLDQKIDLEEKDKFDSTPLIHSLRAGKNEIAKLLIENNANVKALDIRKDTTLNIAVQKCNLEIIKLLVNKGVDVNLKNESGYSALLLASGLGKFEIVEFLISLNVDLNIKSANGVTALTWASGEGYANIVKLLLEKGGDPNIKKEKEHSYKGSERLFEDEADIAEEIFRMREIGETDAKSYTGDTALITATKNGFFEIVKLLLLKKANINILDERKSSAVFISLNKGYTNISDLFLNEIFTFKNTSNHTEEIIHFLNLLDQSNQLEVEIQKKFWMKLADIWSKKKESNKKINATLLWFVYKSLNENIKADQIFSNTDSEVLAKIPLQDKEQTNFSPEFHILLSEFYSLHKDFKNTEKYISIALDMRESLLSTIKQEKDLSFYKEFAFAKKKGVYFDLSQKEKEPKIILLNGHNRNITYITFSFDSKFFATASEDNTVKVWSTDGKLLHDLKGHTEKINYVSFSKDGKYIATASNDETIKIWKSNGRLFYELRGHKGKVTFVEFTLDGKHIISRSDNGNYTGNSGANGIFVRFSKPIKKNNSDSVLNNIVKIWSIDGKLLYDLKGHTETVEEIAISPNGKYIVTASNDKTTKIWSIDGKLIHDLKDQSESVPSGKDEKATILTELRSATQISFSPDSKYIAKASDNKTSKIWNMDGKVIFDLKDLPESVTHITFSPDSKYIVTGAADNSVQIYNTSGQLLQDLGKYNKKIKQFIFSTNSQYFAVVAIDRVIDIWKVSDTFEFLYNLNGDNIAFSPDNTSLIYSRGQSFGVMKISGEYLYGINRQTLPEPEISLDGKNITTRSYDRVKTWNLEGKLLRESTMPTDGSIDQFALSHSKKYFAIAKDSTIKILDLTTPADKINAVTFDGLSSVNYLSFSPDEKFLLTASKDKKARIWALDGKLVSTFDSHSKTINSVSISPDYKKIVTSSNDKSIKLWSIDGKLITTIEGHAHWVTNVIFSIDGQILVSSSTDGTIKLWTVNGELITTLKEHDLWIKSITFSPDGKYLIAGSINNSIYIWDVASLINGEKPKNTPRLVQHLNGHTGVVSSLNFLNDGKILVSSSFDDTMKYWDYKNGKLLATQVFFENNSSLVYTPDGYFDYTANSALNYISFKSPYIQNGFIDLQDLMNDYYLDGLLELVTNNKFKPNKKNNLTKGVETTAVVKALFETQESVESAEDNKSLHFQITERGSKFEKAVVYVNGIQVDEKTLVDGENTEGVNLEDDSKEGFFKYRVKFSVPLNFGTNRVEVKAYNAFNIPQSFPAFEIQRKIPDNKELAKPDLYILSVGINDYKTKKLTFSVPDAKAMAEALQQGKTGIYHEVFTRLLVDAKKKDIEDALADIEKKARPQDVVLVYFSGHGMNAFTREGKKLFYFVPQDFKWPDDPENENVARNQGIDADYLDETFTKIKSHKLILILDACHSGSVNTALASRGQDKEKATRKAMEKMANGTGRFIFASSSGNEESREHSEVGHGLYTHVFLNALGKSKDKNITDADSINKDGFIYLSEIRSYIEQQFEEQTAKYLKGVIQTPPSMSLGRNGMHERVNDFPLLKK